MAVLDDINTVLKGLCESEDVPMEDVWYGACLAKHLDHWNFFTFNRVRSTTDSGAKQLTDYYEITIMHENYVPQLYPLTVISALKDAIPGMTVDGELKYEMYLRTESHAPVEGCIITMRKASKSEDI